MKKNTTIISTLVALGLLSCSNQQAETVETKNLADTLKTAKSINTETITPTEINYKSYCNDKCGFCIDYPLDILYPQGESGSGDGQIFKSKTAENSLSVARDYSNVDDSYTDETSGGFSLEKYFENECFINEKETPTKVITYKKFNTEYFVISGYIEGKIFYRKTTFAGDCLVTCVLTYTEKEKEFYNKVAERIFKSLK